MKIRTRLALRFDVFESEKRRIQTFSAGRIVGLLRLANLVVRRRSAQTLPFERQFMQRLSSCKSWPVVKLAK